MNPLTAKGNYIAPYFLTASLLNKILPKKVMRIDKGNDLQQKKLNPLTPKIFLVILLTVHYKNLCDITSENLVLDQLIIP